MDQHKLRTLVFEKTGVRIDVDDPIFALVALNEAVLAEAVERHVALLDDATADLEDQLLALGARNQAGSASAAPVQAMPAALPSAPGARQPLAMAAGTAMLAALLVLLGQALWFKPAPPAPPAPIMAPLSPAQEAQLREAEKLKRIIGGLDAKTRNVIDTQMQKP